ncbi:hypothetical protein [Paludisphaera soli]|uniref:hypothetical protein n=1 Tax=Paludisphaera soli TaxID=2712865 RepID=UPI0013E9CD9B|nr:hypothetical protein [Paludisphaera soli]
MQYDPDRLLEIIREGAEIHQELDDRSYVDFVRGCGEEGLRTITEILKAQVDETDESIACYSANLIIRSQLPGRVGVILETLRLPFRNPGVRDEVLETIFDEIVGDPEFLRDAEVVSEARRVEAGYPWVREQIGRFLRNATDMDA